MDIAEGCGRRTASTFIEFKGSWHTQLLVARSDLVVIAVEQARASVWREAFSLPSVPPAFVVLDTLLAWPNACNDAPF